MMSVATAWKSRKTRSLVAHPNELDLLRIRRSLEQRARYRYVTPVVHPMPGGYLIRSACCSRNIEPAGGEIDIARICWDQDRGEWSLLGKDHAAQTWIEDGRYARLPELLLRVNSDPDKRFWQ